MDILLKEQFPLLYFSRSTEENLKPNRSNLSAFWWVVCLLFSEQAVIYAMAVGLNMCRAGYGSPVEWREKSYLLLSFM